MLRHGHTPCPGSPGAPSGRPGVPAFLPPVPSTGRRPRAPAPWRRTAPAPRAACAPARRSRACAPARRGRSRTPRTTSPARSAAGAAASARPSAPGACAASDRRPCRAPVTVHGAARPWHRRQPRHARRPAPAAQVAVQEPRARQQRVVRADSLQPHQHRGVTGMRRNLRRRRAGRRLRPPCRPGRGLRPAVLRGAVTRLPRRRLLRRLQRRRLLRPGRLQLRDARLQAAGDLSTSLNVPHLCR